MNSSGKRVLSSLALLWFWLLACTASATVLPLEAGQESWRPYANLQHFCSSRETAPDIDQLRLNLATWPWQASGHDVPNHGYTTDICWYRLSVENRSHAATNFVLGLDYPLLTLVDMWLLDADQSVLTHYREGADLPYRLRQTRALAFGFALELPPQSPRDILLRLDTPNLQLPMVLMEAQAFTEYDLRVTLVHSLFIGGMLVMILYNLLLYVSLRESVWLPYVCWAAVITVLQVVLLGFGPRFLWPDSPAFLTLAIETILSLILIIAPWFVIRFLRLDVWTPLLARILWAHALIGAMLLLAIPFADRTALMVVQLVSILSLGVIAITAVLQSRQRGEEETPEVNGFIIAWGAFLLGAFLLILNKLGLLPRNLFTEHLLEVGSFLAVALLSRALAAQINRLKAEKARAEAMSQAKSEFLATMSHEIRTPMNGVLGLSDLLRHTPLNTQQGQYVDTIYQSSQALLTVINDILDYSKIEAGRLSLESLDTSLEQLLGDCVALHAPRIIDKRLALWVRLESDVPTLVRTDPLRLKQILNNLLSNACKFTDAGEIRLRISRQPGSGQAGLVLRIEVEDSGIGLNPDEQERLFRSYEQAAAGTSRQYGGTGLGLAICKRLVELLGGEIGVTSSPGRGARFWFTLPVEKSASASPGQVLEGKQLCVLSNERSFVRHVQIWAQRWGMNVTVAGSVQQQEENQDSNTDILLLGPDFASERDSLAISGGPALLLAWPVSAMPLQGTTEVVELPLHPLQFQALLLQAVRTEMPHHAKPDGLYGNGLSHLRVLVAEDNTVNQLVIVSLLKSLGIDATVVDNGEQALKTVTAMPGKWDVVFMDTEMPVMDGHTATRRIREWETAQQRAASWIIAISAHATPDRIQEARAAGVSDYLGKPVTRAHVLEALRHAMRES
ncbi:MAG: 7TM diverse intracellular signaling domain-containing protein [Moraxellaceae bacterium]|nr:7TM diverse intracellular signaling domain-containing protein [Moraxellaceae bacterium]